MVILLSQARVVVQRTAGWPVVRAQNYSVMTEHYPQPAVAKTELFRRRHKTWIREARMNTLEADILELTGEDDYGSWELWWRVAQLHRSENSSSLMGSFVVTIENMISRGILKAKRKTPLGQLQPVKF